MKEVFEELCETLGLYDNPKEYIIIISDILAASVFGALGGICLIVTMIKAKAIVLLIPIIASILLEIVLMGVAVICMGYLQVLFEHTQDE